MIFTRIMSKHRDGDEKSKEQDIAIILMELFLFVLTILATLFYVGNHAIEKNNMVQLVENDSYMVSYCDGERYVLHKVQYSDEEIIIFRNEQKIVAVENNEISIRKIKGVYVKD